MLQRHTERVRGTAVLIFKLSTRWRWVNNVEMKILQVNIQYSATSLKQRNSAFLW